MRTLDGKRVLVTGGAMGLGREIALKFATAGSRVVLTDIREAELADTAGALRAICPSCETHVLDVTDGEAIARVRDAVLAGGPVDVLVNNAGVVFGGSFLDVPMEKHLLTYRVNTLCMVAVTHAFLPHLLRRPEAHIVNIASASAFIALPGGTTYASSKWAALGFSESLRVELAESGAAQVKVTAICPSYVGTGMFEGVKPPRLTRLLTPDLVAARVVDAVQREKAIVYEPPQIRMLTLLRGVLPLRLFDRATRMMGVQDSMADWRGHAAQNKVP